MCKYDSGNMWDFEVYEETVSPCINCGHKPIFSVRLAKNYDNYEYGIYCESCDSEPTRYYKDIHKAVSVWNLNNAIMRKGYQVPRCYFCGELPALDEFDGRSALYCNNEQCTSPYAEPTTYYDSYEEALISWISAQLELENRLGTPEWDKPKENPPEDKINHPSHYTSGDIECIDAIKASMSAEEYRGYLKGNALKYLWRYTKKGAPIEDLGKANWYIERLRDDISQ